MYARKHFFKIILSNLLFTNSISDYNIIVTFINKKMIDPLFLDFITQCLEWDPERRITPAMALRHSWLRRRLPRPPAAEHQHYSQESTPTSLRVKLSESNHHQTLPMHSRNSQISGKLPQITSTCIM